MPSRSAVDHLHKFQNQHGPILMTMMTMNMNMEKVQKLGEKLSLLLACEKYRGTGWSGRGSCSFGAFCNLHIKVLSCQVSEVSRCFRFTDFYGFWSAFSFFQIVLFGRAV